ncbi:MAG: S8 family serine peptidase, partial [Anaerolineae bacterium]
MKLKSLAIFSLIMVMAMVAGTAMAAPAAPGSASGGGLLLQPADATGPALYIVQLADPPLASYYGGMENYAATSPTVIGATKLDVDSAASRAYLDNLQSVQDAFTAQVEAALGRSVDIRYSYQVAFNGIAITLTPAEAAQVAALDGVKLVVRETVEEMLTDTGPTFIGAPGIWNGTATGGLDGTYGEGVIVGIIDSGINVVD